jgi:hypothetical protein
VVEEEVQKDFGNIFKLGYDEALDSFRQFHNGLKQSNTKTYTGMGEGPIVEQLQSEYKEKHVGQVGQEEFSVICFKCGVQGHISKLCKFNINPCSITTCNSYKHNIDGHKAMEKLGKTVLPDKVTAAGVVTPAGATTAADALALKKNKKSWPKIRKKMTKEK